MNFCPYCQLPLEAPVAQCPSCYADLASSSTPPVAPPPGRAGGTMVESVADLRNEINEIRSTGTVVEKTQGDAFAPAAAQTPKPEKKSSRHVDDGTVSFRPMRRFPTIKVCVLDDSSREHGEWVRVRTPSFVIGRREGDIVIPHDDDMSSTHLEIMHTIVDNQYRVHLKDLNSTNGSFIRISRLQLRKNQEILIGATRYRFDPGSMETASSQPTPSAAAASTRGWQSVDPSHLNTLFPALIEITSQGDGKRYELRQDEQQLGRDAKQCQLVINDDPFVSPVHVKIHRDKQDRWILENNKSLNGIWLRFTEVPINTDGEIQLGEQRFLIRFPPRT